MTNLEGFRKYGDNGKMMDEIDLRAYIGLLFLVGVFRSRGKAKSSLWDSGEGERKGDFPCHDAIESLSHFLNNATIW